ncbi:MAG: sigma 54-dependent Fis family transcriptional regulator [Deltaproteobacteria bacterium]|nr:sigma 54-dependent Fis family transcriptional regulator [Deltaproteobacteria bacterium]
MTDSSRSESGEDRPRGRLESVPEELSEDRFQLTVVSGPDRGAVLERVAGRVTVGTAATNDLCLRDPAASRQHLEFFARDGGYFVRDLGSRSGTWLGAVQVVEARVSPGATVRLGATELCFDATHAVVPVGASLEDHFGELHGASLVMRSVYSLLDRVAGSSLTALLVGETGTGKELAARALHAASRRAERPFVTLDCGAVNENLIESELFGHERGAFTGAERSRAGAFERAQGGTIFLDEIGELPLELQPKLLRVLERREVTRIGAGSPIEVDVRVIAATHRDLPAMAETGAFREDLLYRIAEVVVPMPPLREHPEDIPALAGRLLDQLEGPPRRLSRAALTYLAQQPWPGNVRELRNVLRRAAALSRDSLLDREDFTSAVAPRRTSHPPELASGGAGAPEVAGSLRELRRSTERDYLARLQLLYGRDLDRAAAQAGLHRKSLERLLRQHGLLRRR